MATTFFKSKEPIPPCNQAKYSVNCKDPISSIKEKIYPLEHNTIKILENLGIKNKRKAERL